LSGLSPENDVDGLAAVLPSPEAGCFRDVSLLKNEPHHEIIRIIQRTGQDRCNDLYYPVIGLPMRITSAKKLVDILKTLARREREAFGIQGKTGADRPASSNISIRFCLGQEQKCASRRWGNHSV
jgi:hypothetical protein